jgi:conjugative transfer signal peptidase TraF
MMRNRQLPARRSGTRRSAVPLAATALALVLGSAWFLAAAGARICLSPSAPAGLYLPTTEPLGAGTWVQLCLPEPIVSFGRARGYHPDGWPPASCPDGSAAVLKRVAALPGDLVEVREEGLVVNGRLLAATRPQPVDSEHRPLPRLAGLRRRVPEGQCWLYSDTVPNSWDSRYYGPIPMTSIVTAMRPLLTL